MKRAGIIALCLLAGWVGGYQHKKLKMSAAATASAERSLMDRAAEMPSDLFAIKTLSEHLEPRLIGQRDTLQIALMLRNMLHHRVPTRNVTLDGYDFTDLDATFARSVLNPAYGHLCGGIAIQYVAALRAFGIPARKVGIYPEVESLHDNPTSHAAVDVKINGKWIAMDPTYNVSLKNSDGHHIGWFDAAELLQRGIRVTESNDGYQSKEDLTLETYLARAQIRLSDLLQYLNASPYWDGTATRDELRWPERWDGTLRYKSGKIFDAVGSDSSGVYSLLSLPGTPDCPGCD